MQRTRKEGEISFHLRETQTFISTLKYSRVWSLNYTKGKIKTRELELEHPYVKENSNKLFFKPKYLWVQLQETAKASDSSLA